VLVVDDGPADRGALTMSLEEAGARVRVNASARDADRADALHAAFQLRFQEPISPRALVDVVARLVRSRPASTNQIK
jgi:CheY-like chemotaxis protein